MHYMAFMKIMDGASKRVSRTISLAETLQKEVEGGAVCLPKRSYLRGRLQEIKTTDSKVTCAGRQKIKLGSKPLI